MMLDSRTPETRWRSSPLGSLELPMTRIPASVAFSTEVRFSHDAMSRPVLRVRRALAMRIGRNSETKLENWQ